MNYLLGNKEKFKLKIIYDNIIFSLQKAGGISKYWAELIKRIIKKEDIIFYEFSNQNIYRNKLCIKTQKESSLNIKLLRYLPFMKALPQKSIFHSSYYRVSMQKNIINIITLYDFIYEYFRKGLAKYVHVLQKGFAVKRSDGIICISENTKKDLLKYYPLIDESKLKVIYLGVGDAFIRLENPSFYLINEFEVLRNKKYILYVGERSCQKNFDITIKIMKEIKRYYLVVAGGKEFKDDEKNKMKDIKNRIYHFKDIDEGKLNILYNNAFCLLYPSSYEGFGLPILEAMQAGCPVISTNISSIPEIAGEAGILVNDIKAENFIDKIKKLEINEFRCEIIQKGLKQSLKFNWDKCFNETFGFYQEIWNKKFRK